MKGAAVGYALGKSETYNRMGAKGATGHVKRYPRLWER